MTLSLKRVPVLGLLEAQEIPQQFHSTQIITLAICQGGIIFILIIIVTNIVIIKSRYIVIITDTITA